MFFFNAIFNGLNGAVLHADLHHGDAVEAAHEHLILLASRVKLRPIEVDLGDWSAVVKLVDGYLELAGGGPCAVLAWEPQLSWLVARLQERRARSRAGQ